MLLATDTALAVIPGAGALRGAGKISQEALEATVKYARGAGYAATVLGDGALAGAEIYNEGLSWQSSGQLVGILFKLGAVKITSRDALRTVEAGASGLKPGTQLRHFDSIAVGQSAEKAGKKAFKSAKGKVDTPEGLSPQLIETGTNDGKYKVVDSIGMPVGLKRYDTIEDATKAANDFAILYHAPTARVWDLEGVTRGKLIESILAKTEYSGWAHIGQWKRGFNKSFDFQNGLDQVSLKSVDTNSSGWLSRMENHINQLFEVGRFDEGGDIILDIRVQPGGMVAAQEQLEALRTYGEAQNIIVKIKEFP